ncbi:NAD-dependent succinate-semialdehyde dehydrogenase [Nocardioides sp. SLBN-35]|uniref:NAD-dependent succinate-semialdehyde dehydrogenase n=1 Tax=Nocardioides sp. SLBN-35 TaxID=2768445 RepID=UPI001168E69D|nr:NAD-dependent succinate-semialdehyde dehydrogenase [Nocardioides sp. SLBN-35]TQK72846.1 succinate semialdehyde dehydrogenase [Nocardioides sp. SLBN-35]
MSTDRERQLLATVRTDLLVAGEWRGAGSGATFAVEDPATERVLAQVADATAEDGTAALDAAHRAQRDWGRTPPRERGELLRLAYQRTMERADDFALLMTLEMGKPLAEALGEVRYAAEFLRWFSEEAVRIDGRYVPAPDGRSRLLVHHRPVGPCLFVTPWNFPLAMVTRKVAPAIAAGCTMVIKPPALTPLSTLFFAQLLEECGLPAGVLNVVPTSRASSVVAPLVADPRLRKLSFTGSTEVGRRLLRDAADQVLRTSMELGGNAPLLVFEDADLDVAVEGALAAKLRNMGQACTAANRLLVQRSVAEEFADRLARRMAALRTGRGTESGVEIGPLIDGPSRAKVQQLVDDAVERGARVLTGGAPEDGAGHFYPPTVLVDVPAGARVLTEEIFGPVAPIVTFADEAEGVALANATEYGLAAYAFTRDGARQLRLAETVDSGMLGINLGVISNAAAPFGGIKQSGLGREGGAEGIHEYLDVRYVGIADPFTA